MKYQDLCVWLFTAGMVYGANPEPSAGILATQDASKAGERKSNSNLVMVCDVIAPVDATISLVNPKDIPQGYSQWSGDGLVNPQNGSSSVKWQSRSSSTITSKLNSTKEVSVKITTVSPEKQSLQLDMEPGSRTAKFVDAANEVVSKMSKGSRQLEAGGKIKVGCENVDFYNDGEKHGIKVEGEGTASATFPEMDLDFDVPTPVPGIQFEAELNMEEAGLSLTTSGAYDESKSPVGTFKATGKIGAEISVEVGLEAGIEDQAEVDLDIGGKIFLGGQVDVGYESKEIFYTALIGIDKPTVYVKGTVTFLGGEFELFNFPHEFEEIEIKKEIEKTVIYTFE
jgi:hypothetical protein